MEPQIGENPARMAIDSRIEQLALEINTALPARVVSYQPATQRAKVELSVLITLRSGEELPPIVIENMLVFFPGGSGGRLSTEIKPNETGIVLFMQRALDDFKDGAAGKGGQGAPASTPRDIRRFSLQDGVFMPGYFSGGLGTPQATGIINDSGETLTLAMGEAKLKSGQGEVMVSTGRAEMKTAAWKLKDSLERAQDGGRKNDESAVAAAIAPWPGVGAVVALKNSIQQTITGALEAIALESAFGLLSDAASAAETGFKLFGKAAATGVSGGKIDRAKPIAAKDQKPPLEVAIQSELVALVTPAPSDHASTWRRGWSLPGMDSANSAVGYKAGGAGEADFSAMSAATGVKAEGAEDNPRAYTAWADLVAFYMFLHSGKRQAVFSWLEGGSLGGIRRIQISSMRNNKPGGAPLTPSDNKGLILDIPVPAERLSGTARPNAVNVYNAGLWGFLAESSAAVNDFPSGWGNLAPPITLIMRFFDSENKSIVIDPMAFMQEGAAGAPS